MQVYVIKFLGFVRQRNKKRINKITSKTNWYANSFIVKMSCRWNC